MILVSLGALTSVMAGFVVFSVLGFMAHDTGLAIEDVVRAGKYTWHVHVAFRSV